MKQWKLVAISMILFGLSFFAFNNCSSVRMEKVLPSSQDTISGNPIVVLRALAYTSAISDFRLCIDNYEFRNGDIIENVPGDQVEKTLSPQSSVPLINGPVPVGIYSNMRLHLRNNCGTGSSFRFSNLSGPIVVADEAIMQFNGVFEVTAEGINLNLQFEPFTDAFEGAEGTEAAVTIANTQDGVIVP